MKLKEKWKIQLKGKMEIVFTILANPRDMGVGFYINKHLPSKIIEIKGTSEKIVVVKVQINPKTKITECRHIRKS